MFKNYIRLALKSISSQGQQTIISSLGLSVALSCCILIMLFVQYEFSYDRFHEGSGNIYRIISRQPSSHSYMGKSTFAVTPATLKDALKDEIPGTRNSTKCKLAAHTLEYNASLFSEKGFLYADPDFLKVFSFPVLRGNPAEELREPFTLFLTREMAEKYFGSEDPVGKVLKADNKYTFTVKGVLEDIPENSHLRFGFLTGFETFYSMRGGREKVEVWDNFSYITYVSLEENANPGDYEAKMAELPGKYLADEPFFAGLQWILLPLDKIHLGGNSNFEPGNNSDIRYIWLVVAIGIFILLIACFNYMNMATARAYERGREAGILKVAGSSRTDLVMQFVAESVLVSFGGLVLALVIIWLIMPFFAVFIERPLAFRMIFEYSTLIRIAVLTLVAGVLAGIYPALHLSSMSPLRLIREDFMNPAGRGRSVTLRNLLVMLQYTIAIAALISTFTVLKQLKFLRNADTGFLSENILTISVKDPALRSKPQSLLNELKAGPDITDVTVSSSLPHAITSASNCQWEGKEEGVNVPVFRAGGGADFADFYNIRIVEGRWFSRDFSADSANSFILNQAAVKRLGWEDPVGRKFGFNGDDLGTVVGIMEDFNFQSLHLAVEPLAMSLSGGRDFPDISFISVKIKPEGLSSARTFVEKTLKELSPHYINPVSFLGDQIDTMYKSERKLSWIFVFSTVLAVVLTCLGQYSLSSYTTRSRTKEMVIRKVMGSQASGIVMILAREMAKLILAAVLVAWPLAYLLMDRWLQKFAFHADIGASVFLLSLAISLAISMVAISYHVLRLSVVNPALMIRQE
ncbi:MAG: ABC transporter permease [Bacteroidales bacterium]|nr:ABC transporter permease [Bacteroidales bacterium]